MMIMYGFGFAMWMANSVNGGMNGSDWHRIWVYLSKVFCIAPIMTMIFTLVAMNSYGNLAAVLTSWSGNATYASNTVVPATLN